MAKIGPATAAEGLASRCPPGPASWMTAIQSTKDTDCQEVLTNGGDKPSEVSPNWGSPTDEEYRPRRRGRKKTAAISSRKGRRVFLDKEYTTSRKRRRESSGEENAATTNKRSRKVSLMTKKKKPPTGVRPTG